MKRRIISLILVFGMVLAGCNVNMNTKSGNTESASEAKTEDDGGDGTDIIEEDGIILNDGSPWVDSDLKIVVDNSTRPDEKDDFYFSVNYDWLCETDIKEGSTSESSFTAAGRNTTQKALKLMTDDSLTGHDADLVRSLYNTITDWDKRNKLGIEPVKPVLNDIAGISSLAGLNDFICDPDRSNCVSTFVSIANETDLNDSNKYIVYINNDSLLLEDAAEYINLTSAGERAYEAKKTVIKSMYARLGISEDEAEARFNRVMGFEEEIAKKALSRADFNSPDIYDKINNVYSKEEIGNLTKAFPLKEFIDGFGYGDEDRYAIYQPEVIKRFDELYTEDNLDVMKDYMVIHYLLYAVDKLDRECSKLEEERINTQYGTEGSTDDETTAYNKVLKLIPEPLERVYLDKYSAAEMKKDITDICEEIIDGYKVMIAGEEWLTEETKERAVQKLSKMKIKAVYPDKWMDYSGLDLEGLNYLECCQAINRFNGNADRERTGKRVDNDIWTVNILQCNAFYSRQDNSINIILGILDDAFYNMDMTREEKLGGIGSVIGHEISHAIDETGAGFDEEGNLYTWWSDSDKAVFNERAERLVSFYDGILCFNGTNETGSNVKDEALADMAGMKVLLDIAGREDDFDYDKFFRQNARIWRSITSPEAEYDKLIKGEHPLNYLRTNVTLQQFDEFLDTYDIKEGDGMYLAKEDRIAVW